MPIHLLIPMSGQGTRYQKAGYRQPKPMIPVSGIPMIKRLLDEYPIDWPTHFVVAENHLHTELPAYLSQLRPDHKLTVVAPHSEGPGRAILEAIESLPADAPVLVSYCDFGMVWDARQFERFVETSHCDACLISYRGFHAHYLSPVTYAYSRMQGERVVEVREKGSFTENRENEYASAGAYYFRSAALLKKALRYQVDQGLKLNGELYTSLTVQALLQMQPESDVRVFEIPFFYQWGTPQDLQIFEYWEKTFSAYNRQINLPKTVPQVLMPMAGRGSRFEALSQTPKPLIPVGDQPMFENALASLPQAQKTVLVCLDSIRDQLKGPYELISLSETPPGQALSTKAGLKALQSDREVLISSCDHGIVLDRDLWSRFQTNPQCDAAIFTVRGYPGSFRRPQAFAYVETDVKGEFAKIVKVSVKVPLSETPEKDALLVGTFWFRSGEILKNAIERLEAQNLTVNGELYLDSVFALLIEAGQTVREIPLEGYINWGDPQAYAEATYWQENFSGRSLRPQRNLF